MNLQLTLINSAFFPTFFRTFPTLLHISDDLTHLHSPVFPTFISFSSNLLSPCCHFRLSVIFPYPSFFCPSWNFRIPHFSAISATSEYGLLYFLTSHFPTFSVFIIFDSFCPFLEFLTSLFSYLYDFIIFSTLFFFWLRSDIQPHFWNLFHPLSDIVRLFPTSSVGVCFRHHPSVSDIFSFPVLCTPAIFCQQPFSPIFQFSYFSDIPTFPLSLTFPTLHSNLLRHFRPFIPSDPVTPSFVIPHIRASRVRF